MAPEPARQRRRRLTSFALAALLVGACGSTTSPSPSPLLSSAPEPSPSAQPSLAPSPSPAPSVDPRANDTIFNSIEAAVQQLRGLTRRSPVARSILSEDQLKALVTADFAKSNSPALVAANEQLEKALGLLPANASLKDLQLQLLSSQVAGLYDPDTRTMDVISKTGALGPVEQVTYAHEFDHALQDQAFGLKKLGIDDTSNSDRALARLSLPEGDATLLMTQWAETNLTTEQLLQLASEANDPGQAAVLAAMPDDLRETLLFPYEQGLSWVTDLHTAGGWAAVNAAYARPPDSTEQILHPEKYASHEKPIDVTIPADLASRLGNGWTMPLTDTVGELQFRIWLEQVGHLSGSDALNAAESKTGIAGKLTRLSLGARAGLAFVRLMLIPVKKNALPDSSRLMPAW